MASAVRSSGKLTDTIHRDKSSVANHVALNIQQQLRRNNMDFMPPFFSFSSDGPPGMGAPKAVRVEKAENGYVVYLRQPNFKEEMRIAFNIAVAAHIMQEYFTTPVNTNDHITGAS